MLSRDTGLRDKLESNTKYFREKISSAGFTVLGDPNCPIVCVLFFLFFDCSKKND